jgi:tungstate transport system substrate-binding protein
VLACALVTLTIQLACARATPSLEIATTTSVLNSGLLEAILPAFAESRVRVHAAGSGRSLAMLEDRTVALVISHAPNAEQEYLVRHPEWRYQKLATNRFILVGPDADPAGVRRATNVKDAFSRIATSQAVFISRGDGSGTHERETAMWRSTGAVPSAERLIVSGGSMAVTLQQADSQLAYTLTDDATWHQLRGQLESLAEVFGDEPVLLNSYAVIYRNDQRASALAEWLTSGPGRTAIADYRIGGRPAFTVWPQGCFGAMPEAPLCGT